MGRRLVTLVIGLAALSAGAAPAWAEPGDLDPAFSADGRVTALGGDGFVPRGVAIQPDGRIVVAGYSCTPSDPVDATCRTSGASSFRVTRYTADGALDTGFGSGGVVTTAVGVARSQAFDVAIEPGGRIVLAGVARDGAGRDGFALVRYEPSGAIDRSFGEQGTSVAPVGSGFAAISEVAAAAGGGLVAGGVADDPDGGTRFALARYRSDGAPDGSFGAGGFVLGGPAAYNSGLAISLAPAGQVLVAGISGESGDPAVARFGLFRVWPDGRPDAGFGTGGGAIVPVGQTSSFANAVASLKDGRTLAAGAATDRDGRQAMAFVRLTAEGRLDTTWDGDGSALVRIGDGALAADVERDAEDRAVAFGQSASGDAAWAFAIARLGVDGLLDPSFGTGGVAVTTFTGTSAARATAGAIAPDGGLVAVGLACVEGRGPQCAGGSPRLAIARYLGGGPPPPAPGPLGPRVQHAPYAALELAARRVTRSGRIRLRVACLQSASCRGAVTVRTARSYRLGGRRVKRGTVLARQVVTVRAGGSRSVSPRLRRTGRTLVARRSRVSVRVAFAGRDASRAWRESARDATLTRR